MATAGLTQSAIAEALKVSKEAVSQWLNAKSFPRPSKLLQLGKQLDLSFDALVIEDDLYAPKVSFRRIQGTKTLDCHIKKAQEMGRCLRHLMPFLPFDTFEMPPVLRSPGCDYDFLRKVAAKVRHDIKLKDTETIEFAHLIDRFYALQAMIVPVLWGSKKRHENAVHIYLPDSQSTWVYLNLDVNIHDFKFWMAHELGHCLSPSLSGNEAENFADAFAGALLFPHEKAKQAYRVFHAETTVRGRLRNLERVAKKEIVSPDTVRKQVNKYAVSAGLSEIDFGKRIYGWITNFNKGYKNVSETLLGDQSDWNARDYIRKTEEAFKTPFFDMLRQYHKQNQKGPGLVQTLMDMPLLDAKNIHAELT